MVELRKRKAPAEPVPPAPAKRTTKKPKAIKSDNNNVAPAPAATKKEKKESRSASSAPKVPAVGDTIDLEGIGSEITLHDGTATTLKQLVDESEAGVVLFTYPRASTPGCTNQACLFRDRYDNLTSTGLSIFGLSTDSPKANANFKAKQNLSYPLICDPAAGLIAALGLKKVPKGTVRGVFAVDKAGKVLLLQPGGPAATVDAVQELVEASK
ncbi:hypothetical protein FQN50_007309 [Emmonsiellopsis sp. PD_5]|nr:hypothetical protein FQN50_007309 [Emmonsiellopsis sp. PD_5]